MALTKKLGYLQGMKMEAGNFTFAGSATTYELETTLTTILSFQGTTADATALTSDKTVSNGYLTVTRPGSGTDNAAADYTVFGY